MNRPRPRFTAGWVIIAVAVGAAILSVAIKADRRRERLHSIAQHQAKEAAVVEAEEALGKKIEPPESAEWLASCRARSSYHRRAEAAHRIAARFSWLFIEPASVEPRPE